jgi:putative nucleotidyltransferase with HDIG domain
MRQAGREYGNGIYADSTDEAQNLEAQGYHKCGNQLCQFYIDPRVLEEVERYGEGRFQCPHCGLNQDLLAAIGQHPDEFSPGGATHSGLKLGEFGQIGEDLIESLGVIPGYGQIVWWHQGGAPSNSYLDGATAEWGVEVKTINSEAKNLRFIVRPIDRGTKLQAAADPSWFNESLGDESLAEALPRLKLHGVLGLLVILDMATSKADIYAREFPLQSDVATQQLTGIKHFRTQNAKLILEGVPFPNPLEDPRHPDFVPFEDRTHADNTPAIFSRVALDLGAGDAYPGSTPQYENDHFEEEQNGNLWGLPLEYDFVLNGGQIEITPVSHSHLLPERASNGPGARGHVTVENGKAVWQVEGNVSPHALTKVFKDYGKQMDWIWGGLTNIEGEPISDDFAPKKSLYYYYAKEADHLVLSPSAEALFSNGAEVPQGNGTAGYLVVQGRRVHAGGLDHGALPGLLEWADESGHTVVGGNDNVIKTIEDLEQWNFSDPHTDLTEFNKDEDWDRAPEGVFECQHCGARSSTYAAHLDHVRGHEPLVTPPTEDGQFPEVEENAIEDSHFTPQQPGIDVVTRYVFGAGEVAPKDMFSEPVPFIFDIEKDAIYTGHPGAKHSDIEGNFTPGGIVEGTYEPGGKVWIRSFTNYPYSLRHMLELWTYQHPEFEITGLGKRDMEGNEMKMAAVNDPGRELLRLVNNDPSTKLAWETLKGAGGDVYVVGGAVRDVLNGKAPNDLDLLVRGIPGEAVRRALEALPGRVDLTGKDFGVYRYRNAGHETEIALPRREQSTGELHTDFDVQTDYNMNVEEDLARRDFTVNAMAFDLDTNTLIDPFNGQQDIKDKRLRVVHEDSFAEDPTRVIRALVARAKHGFEPDDATADDMRASAATLASEPKERLQKELDKIFETTKPSDAIKLAHDTGVLRYLLPEVEEAWDFDQNNPHHNYPLGEHLINVLDNATRDSDDPDVRLAALLHDIGKPHSAWQNPETGFNHYYRGPDGQGADHETVGAELAEARLKDLKYPNTRAERVRDLIQHHMYPDFSSQKGARKFLNRVGDHADDLLTLRQADRYGKGTDEYQDSKTPVDTQRDLVWEVRNGQQPTDRSGLAINGSDLINAGIPAGPQIGKILHDLTQAVLEDPSLNERETLLDRALSI